MPRCLIITNDFPPRRGGIETFVYELARRFPPGEVVVYTSDESGAPAIADRLIEMLSDPGARAAMGRRGREWARAEWSWDRSYERLRHLLDQASPTVCT